MKLLKLKNPFNAPIYHEETVSSTFDIARNLAKQDEAHGTVICADFQEAGRGRLNRSWKTESGNNLLFTIVLRYGDFSAIPELLTLRTGLAVSLAVEDLVPALAGQVYIKWPNDVMLNSRKAAGILTEADGNCVYIGVGVNVAQREFPEEYRSKATSIIQAFHGLEESSGFVLLEKILLRLHAEIENPRNGKANASENWRERLLERLYKKGELVTFAEGAAVSNSVVEGTLSGIGPQGELLIIPKDEKIARAFVTGELRVY
jgi:BirA family biotin operon repressor/biotin-[acetyl-CoA-carboxylase] ligase